MPSTTYMYVCTISRHSWYLWYISVYTMDVENQYTSIDCDLGGRHASQALELTLMSKLVGMCSVYISRDCGSPVMPFLCNSIR